MSDRDFRVDDVSAADGRIAVAFSWSDAEGRRHEWAQLLELRDGMIVRMRDYASGESARRRLRRVRRRGAR